MTSIVLELLLSTLLLLGAFLLKKGNRVSDSISWWEILCGIDRESHLLASLSYGCIFSEGIECATEEIWTRLNGIRGLSIIQSNIGVLIGAVDFFETRCPTSQPATQIVSQLRSKITSLRMRTHFTLCLCLIVGPRAISQTVLTKTATDYVSFVARFGLAIHDYAPDLIDEYVCHMSQS